MGARTRSVNLYDHLNETVAGIVPRLADTVEQGLLAESGRVTIACGGQSVRPQPHWTLEQIVSHFDSLRQDGELTVHMGAEAIGGGGGQLGGIVQLRAAGASGQSETRADAAGA
jgi:hypothetical protein